MKYIIRGGGRENIIEGYDANDAVNRYINEFWDDIPEELITVEEFVEMQYEREGITDPVSALVPNAESTIDTSKEIFSKYMQATNAYNFKYVTEYHRIYDLVTSITIESRTVYPPFDIGGTVDLVSYDPETDEALYHINEPKINVFEE